MDNTIILVDGTTIDFPLNDDNCRKFRLVDEDGFGESPWFWCHPDDVADMDNDVQDDTIRYGVAANQCLAGLPWGAVFPYTMNGYEVPEVDMEGVIDWSGGTIIYHPECWKKIEQHRLDRYAAE